MKTNRFIYKFDERLHPFAAPPPPNFMVEFTYALVEMRAEGRHTTERRQTMTPRIAELKNKTLAGTGKQWCKISK